MRINPRPGLQRFFRPYPGLHMRRASTLGTQVTMTSPPCDQVVTASLPDLLRMLSSAPSHAMMLTPGLQLVPSLWANLQTMLCLQSASASRLNKIGPRASLVYVRQFH